MKVETPTARPVRGRRLASIGITVTATLAVAVASVEHPRVNAQPPGPGGTDFGDPLPGLTAAQLARFNAGKAGFEEEEGDADGIGPVFNGRSCAECHAGPATGGSSDVLSTRIGAIRNGRFDPLLRFGGPTIQTRGIVGLRGFQFPGEAVPPQATVVARRRSNPLFGFGLVDAVPDESFHFEALLQEYFTPDTAGRPNRVRDLRSGEWVVGKFGWKAGLGSVFEFSADAYKDEMGITVPGFLPDDDGRSLADENPPQGNARLLRFNPVESPNEGTPTTSSGSPTSSPSWPRRRRSRSRPRGGSAEPSSTRSAVPTATSRPCGPGRTRCGHWTGSCSTRTPTSCSTTWENSGTGLSRVGRPDGRCGRPRSGACASCRSTCTTGGPRRWTRRSVGTTGRAAGRGTDTSTCRTPAGVLCWHS